MFIKQAVCDDTHFCTKCGKYHEGDCVVDVERQPNIEQDKKVEAKEDLEASQI